MKKTFLLLLIVVGFLIGQAQSLERSVDSLMASQYKSDGTGAVALVAQRGEITYHKAFGIANFELDIPMRKDMVFEIASMTKQFTAVAILMLAEEGKLSLQDPLKKYVEDFPNAEHITVHHLLNHTAGLTDLQMMDYVSISCGKMGFDPMEYLNRFKQQPKAFDPNEKWEYTNAAYFILGYIIEKSSGLKYEEFMQQRIFNPLQMNHSYCQVGNIRELVKNRAYGYDTDQNIYNAQLLYMFQAYSAGCILSTAEDLFRWNAALKGSKLLNATSTGKLYADYHLNSGESNHYGYGFFLNQINGSISYEHGGGTPGFSSNAIYLPKEDVYVVVLSNCKGNDPEKVSLLIAGLAIGKPFQRSEIKLSTQELAQYVGSYQNVSDSNFFEVSLVDSNLFVQKKNKQKMPMTRMNRICASSRDNFFAMDRFVEYSFSRDKKSKVARLTVKTRRRQQVENALRVEGEVSKGK